MFFFLLCLFAVYVWVFFIFKIGTFFEFWAFFTTRIPNINLVKSIRNKQICKNSQNTGKVVNSENVSEDLSYQWFEEEYVKALHRRKKLHTNNRPKSTQKRCYKAIKEYCGECVLAVEPAEKSLRLSKIKLCVIIKNRNNNSYNHYEQVKNDEMPHSSVAH